ncbi:KilA-N domain-containing protein [Roseivirga seohaensis]|uniref:KilA-N domain-containing protein n=1 Tax=Roseivirga seohaensis TaxID=1914963 RepID=UPI003BABD99D
MNLENVIIKNWNGHEILFELLNDDLMINATNMAKPFGKRPSDFTRLKETDKIIEALIEGYNDGTIQDLGVADVRTQMEAFNEKKVYVKEDFLHQKQTGRDNGTWMHRYLAIDFATWLDPKFKVWLLATIDQILKQLSKQIIDNVRSQTNLESERQKIAQTLFAQNEDYRKLVKIDRQIQDLKNANTKVFKQMRKDFMSNHGD